MDLQFLYSLRNIYLALLDITETEHKTMKLIY